jgi:two-component system, chemotaxis family, protein-glutamate methylesterase/glutaminase
MGLFERYARPSIDVFFDSVACALGSYALGIILTGNLSDGAEGLGQIMKCGGYALVEDPLSAEKSEMPKAAIARLKPHQILPAHEMAPFVIEYVREFASQQERNNSNV